MTKLFLKPREVNRENEKYSSEESLFPTAILKIAVGKFKKTKTDVTINA